MIRRLKEERGLKSVVHIGDGATDLEACPPADAFIGKQLFLNLLKEFILSSSYHFEFEKFITILLINETFLFLERFQNVYKIFNLFQLMFKMFYIRV